MDDRFASDDYIKKLLSNLRAQIGEDVTDSIDDEADMRDLSDAPEDGALPDDPSADEMKTDDIPAEPPAEKGVKSTGKPKKATAPKPPRDTAPDEDDLPPWEDAPAFADDAAPDSAARTDRGTAGNGKNTKEEESDSEDGFSAGRPAVSSGEEDAFSVFGDFDDEDDEEEDEAEDDEDFFSAGLRAGGHEKTETSDGRTAKAGMTDIPAEERTSAGKARKGHTDTAPEDEESPEIVFSFGSAGGAAADDREEEEDFFSGFSAVGKEPSGGSFESWEVIDTRAAAPAARPETPTDIPDILPETEPSDDTEDTTAGDAAYAPDKINAAPREEPVAEEPIPASEDDRADPDAARPFAPYDLEKQAAEVIDCTDAAPDDAKAEEEPVEEEPMPDPVSEMTAAPAAPDTEKAETKETAASADPVRPEAEEEPAPSAPDIAVEEIPSPDGVEARATAASSMDTVSELPRGFVKTDACFGENDKNPRAWMDGDDTTDDREAAMTSRSVSLWHTLLSAFRRSLASTILTAVVTLLIGLWECLPSVRGVLLQLTGAERYIGAPHLIDLELLLVCLALYIPEIRRAVYRFGKQRIYTAPLAAVAVCAASSLYLLLSALLRFPFYPVALPAAFLLCVAQLSRLLQCQAALTSAEICINSRCGTASVLRLVSDMPEVAQAFESDVADGEMPELTLSCARFTQTDDFLRRLDDSYCQPKITFLTTLPAAVAAVVTAVLSALSGGASPVGLGMLVLAASLPLAAFLNHTWTVCRLGMALKARRMTVAGETAVYEIARADTLCLPDTEAFPPASVEIIKIKLCGEQRVDRLFENLSALFRVLGGPLCGAFTVSGGASAVGAPSVSVLAVEENGIVADIDGERFCVGRGSFMEENGVTFYYDPEDEHLFRDPEAAIMFVAVEGVGFAKLYLRYHVSHAFETYVNRLHKRGFYVLLRTADPNIDTDMLRRLSCFDRGAIGLLRAHTEASAQTPEVSSGLVAYGIPPRRMYATRFLFGAYIRLQKLLPLLGLVGIPVTALICGVAAAVGSASLPFIALICQLLFVIPTVLATEVTMREHKEEDETSRKTGDDERNTK